MSGPGWLTSAMPMHSTYRFRTSHPIFMNSEAVSALVAKNPSLKAAKAKLEAMEAGSYCIHRSWGFGLIKAYDELRRS